MKTTIPETKQNLIDAYCYLYTANIPSKITVKMITDRAGYNRGTFYAYFLDIEDLHNQIEDSLLPSDEKFKKLRDATFSKNGQEIVRIFMNEDRVLGEKVNFLLGPNGSLSFQTKLKDKLKELMLKYAPLELKESKKVIDYKINMICSIFYETIHYWYDEGKNNFNEEEFIKLMMNIIFYGVSDGNF
jgi:AcrR family transcriptional regulator